MNFYFKLQFKRLHRLVKEEGLNPFITFGVLLALFIAISSVIFSKTEYAPFLYPIFFVSIVNLLNGKNRNDFLKQIFPKSEYFKVRILENLIIAFPFLIFLLVNQKFILLPLILALGILASFFGENSMNLVIPTPFFKKPFEFIIGFRKNILFIIIAYVLAGLSIVVENYNIGFFALILVIFISTAFYSKPEDSFFIWIHSQNPRQFLIQKAKTLSFQSFLLSSPVVLILLFADPSKFHFVILLEILGATIISLAMLGKYAYFPSEINIATTIALIVCAIFPPLLLIAIPTLYNKAKVNLSPILK